MKQKIVLSILAWAIHFYAISQCSTTPCPFPNPVNNPALACILPSQQALTCYQGATDTQWATIFPSAWCTTVENNQWLAFTATSSNFDLEIECLSCDTGSGIQAAIFETSDCANLNFFFVSQCLDNIEVGTAQTLSATGLTPGQVYYLMIDGFAGASCDYSINGPSNEVDGFPSHACISSSAQGTYFTESTSSWSIDPPSAGTIIGSPIGSQVFVNWVEEGNAQICAENLDCPTQAIDCFDVSIGSDSVQEEYADICLPGSVICAGETFHAPGVYQVVYPSSQGCDSIINCIINPIPPVITPIFQVDLCAPDTYEVCGNILSVSGIYSLTCQSWQACDSLVNVDLAIMDPIVEIQTPDPLLTCEPNPIVTLDATASTFNVVPNGNTIFHWSGPGIIGPNDGVTVDVNEAGTYCLELTHERNGVICKDTMCIDVVEVNTPPDASQIFGPDSLYWSNLGYFETSEVPFATNYRWTVSQGILEEVDHGLCVFVDFGNFSTAEICLIVENGCGEGPEVCHTVHFGPTNLLTNIFGETTVCGTSYESYIFETPDMNINQIEWHVLNGTIIDDQDLFIPIIEWEDGPAIGQLCVSVESGDFGFYQNCIEVEILDTSNAQLFAIDTTTCIYDCILITDELICEEGEYIIGTVNNDVCEEIWEVDYSTIEVNAVIATPEDLDCNNSSVTLDASASSSGPTIINTWTGPGVIMYTGSYLTVDQPGEYCLEVRDSSISPPCINMTCVEVFEQDSIPTANLSGGGEICEGNGEMVDITIQLTGTAPWEVNWEHNGASQTPMVIDSSPHVLTYDDTFGGSFEITGVTDNCGNQGLFAGTATITVNPQPTVANIQKTSSPISDGCIISFEIWDNNPTVEPFGSGTISGSNPYIFTSNVILNGSNYEFLVTNEFGCGPVVISDTQVHCDCITTAGEMDLTQMETCAPGYITATYDDTNQILDGNDVVNFAIHKGSGNLLIDHLATNDEPTFFLNQFATPGEIYYISAIVGNDLGTGWVDVNDPCLQVAPGTPFLLLEIIDARITGDSLRSNCQGDCDQLEIVLEDSGPWEITINGEVINVNSSPFYYDVCPNTPNFTYTLESVSSQNCMRDINQTITYTEHPQPTAEISGGGAICDNLMTAEAEIVLTGTAPWAVEWSLDGLVQPSLNISASPYTLVLNSSQIGTISLGAVTDGNGCTNLTNQSTTTFTQVEAPMVNILAIDCNATATAYTVVFEITGGDPNSYGVEPAGSGTITGSIFTSNEIPSGQGYSFTISDANDCDPQTISEPQVICDCISTAGEMDQFPLDVCGDGPAIVTYLSGEMLDANDVLNFVLHDGFFGTIYSTNPIMPEFSFDPSMMDYGLTYYVSSIVGNDDGTGLVDLNDPCLSLSNSSMLTFYEIPTLTFVQDDLEVCEGQSVALEVDFTGNAPWSFVLETDHGQMAPYNNITQNPFTIQVVPTETTVYSISNFEDGNCSGTSNNASVEVILNSLMVQALSSDTTICDGDSLQLHVNVPTAIQYDWAPATGLSCTNCPNPVAKPLQSTNYKVTATDNFGCTIEENVQVFVQCFTEYDTLAIGQVGIKGLNLPPWQATPTDICVDDEEHTSIGFFPNGFFYVGLSAGTDTICVPLDHPNPLINDDLYTLYVTIIKKPIFNLQEEPDKFWSDEDKAEGIQPSTKKSANFKESDNIRIYPNPVSDVLNIVSEGSNLRKIELFNLAGQRVLEESAHNKKHSLLLNEASPGSYILKVETESEVYFKKLIVLSK